MEAINLLLGIAPKAVIVKNKKGETALDQAKASKANLDIIKILEDATKTVLEARAQKAKDRSSKKSDDISTSSKDKSSNRRASSLSSLDGDSKSRKSAASDDSSEKRSKKSSSKLKAEKDSGSKSPVTTNKRRSVSPGTKKRASRRSSTDSSGSKGSPVDSPKTEKKGLRRMLKAASFRSKSPSAPEPSPAKQSSSKERLNKSDHRGPADKKEKKKMTNSDHGPDRRERGEGLSRSKSDRGFRQAQQQMLQQEEDFASQLQASKASPSSAVDPLPDRSFRRGGRKPSDNSGSASLSPKDDASKRRSRSRSRKRRSQVNNKNGDSSSSTSPVPPPSAPLIVEATKVDAPKAAKRRSRSKKRSSSAASISSDIIPVDSTRSTGSSQSGSSISSGFRKSGSSSTLSSLRNSLKRTTSSRKSKKNSAKLGLEETPVMASALKKFSNSKRGTLVAELFSSSSTAPFQSKLPMEEEDDGA